MTFVNADNGKDNGKDSCFMKGQCCDKTDVLTVLQNLNVHSYVKQEWMNLMQT